MTDWADEIAKELDTSMRFDSDTGANNKERIAAALRKAKADGLKEAAKLLEQLRVPIQHRHLEEITDKEYGSYKFGLKVASKEAIKTITEAASKLDPS